MSIVVRSALAALLCLSFPRALLAADATSAQQPPPATDASRQDRTLSDKLDATNGVIHPEGAVDAGMVKPAPAVGTMPVIPPAGTPGNAPGVQPK